MKKTKIGILSIGSGVGQSVVTSCGLSSLPLHLVGLGTNPLAYGMYDCDTWEMIPSFYAPTYVDELLDTARKLELDLLIPGHDDEAHILSKHAEQFESAGIGVLCAGEPLLALCRDKERMSEEFNKIAHVFVRGFGRQKFLSAFERGEVELPVISKPRAGFASKGVEIINTPEDFVKILETHIIQELAIPHDGDSNHAYCLEQMRKGINPQVSEVSIQVVMGKDGTELGRMASYNKLNNGVPIEILPYENAEMWAVVDSLIPYCRELGLKGPFNLQGRMTNHGLKLFELNARFTGITGLRAQMGFNEVDACIRNWLWDETPTLRINQRKAGIRQVLNRTVDRDRNEEVRGQMDALNGGVLRDTKTVLITGSTGAVGRRVAKALAANPGYEVITLDRDRQKAASMIDDAKVQSLEWADWEKGAVTMGNVDVLVHLASARPHHTPTEIAQSLALTSELFTKAVRGGVHEVLYASSQSIYATGSVGARSESASISPTTIYGLSKYQGEIDLRNLKEIYPQLKYGCLRFGTLTGSDTEISNIEAVAKLTHMALQDKPITIHGGEQLINRLDVEEAAQAIICQLNVESSKWLHELNVGSDEQITLREVMTAIEHEVKNATGKTACVTYTPDNDNVPKPSYLLNSNRFKKLTGWKPERLLLDSIREIIRELRLRGEG